MIKSQNIEELSKQKAQKHLKISLEAKKLIKQKYPDYCVYLATHSSGKHGRNYQGIEEKSGEKFWKLPYYSQINRKGKLKEPDIVVADGNIVKYLIEVKWGAIDRCLDTDALLSKKERDKIEKAYLLGKKFKICKLEPVIIDIDKKMKFILISDFQKMKEIFSAKKYIEILSRLKEIKETIIITDIYSSDDEIPSFGETIGLNL